MGMFDSLYVRCSRCGEDVEFQSKAGECYCNSYNVDNCPPAIAGDLIGKTRSCKCGNFITLRGHVFLSAEQSPSPDLKREQP